MGTVARTWMISVKVLGTRRLLDKDSRLDVYTLEPDLTWKAWVGVRFEDPFVRFTGTLSEIVAKAREIRDSCPLSANYAGAPAQLPDRWLDIQLRSVLRAEPSSDLIVTTTFTVMTCSDVPVHRESVDAILLDGIKKALPPFRHGHPWRLPSLPSGVR